MPLDAERALAGADAADLAVARGEPLGPLHGVPFTVKDTIAAAGIEMTMGAPAALRVEQELGAWPAPSL